MRIYLLFFAFCFGCFASENVSNAVLPGLDKSKTSWRDVYTVGAGDVLDLSFYGRPELTRKGLIVSPSGTISYLQALEVPVSGKSIRQVQEALESRLKEYFREPRVVVLLRDIRSKRYRIMGKVNRRGTFALKQPMTLVEAVANSHGLQVGLSNQNTVELADMDRSFIVRNGEHLPVDFKKLFLQGDLSQNVEIEPGDYIYIASNVVNQYYILGAVVGPGAQNLSPDTTIISALAERRGYADWAKLKQVLIVRGSLQNPETILVNVSNILSGKEPDVPIKAKDIIYVPTRSTYRLELIAKSAARAFVQSATTTWVNGNVPEIIDHQILPETGWKN